ncbi:MAG TPA: aminoacyl-tRNA hydrolase [Opitutaceae bacterium]|nr:aminoacyl-tRNA hydrolase [Opitutaceae bacterium]
MSIALVAGLGNPGREYAPTRHNLGWSVVESLARKHGLAWKGQPALQAEVARWEVSPGRVVWLARPLSFMNESGRPVAALARYHRLAPGQVAAVYDDLTLEVGRVKVTTSGSAGGHNGVASLLEHLGEGFARYRLGIGPKEPAGMDLKDYVLGRFSAEQLVIIEQKRENHVAGLELLIASGPEQAMNRLNRREPPEPAS